MSLQAETEIEKTTIRTIMWRILPIVMLGYFLAYIDRTNVSFAALTMNKDIGLSAYVFGLGAGIFFLGYVFFEIPSNIMLEKVGARIWIPRIMVSWGILAGLMSLVQGPVSFVAMRFLLGMAEAGFFPGIILYFTYWFPNRYRARVIGYMYLAVPISNGLGAALSGVLLGLDGWLGLKGWLEAKLESERKQIADGGQMSIWKAMFDWRVLVLCFIYLTTTMANYGLTFFMPQVLKGLGQSNLMTGFMAAVPYLLGMIGVIAFGWSSDRFNERRWHLVAACVLGTIGLVGAGLFNGSFLQLAMMTIATIGIYGSRAPFWAMPSGFLTGTAAAAGIAMVNSIGNIGGYIGPFVVGWIRDSTQRFEPALYALAFAILLGAVVTLLVPQLGGSKPQPNDK